MKQNLINNTNNKNDLIREFKKLQNILKNKLEISLAWALDPQILKITYLAGSGLETTVDNILTLQGKIAVLDDLIERASK